MTDRSAIEDVLTRNETETGRERHTRLPFANERSDVRPDSDVARSRGR